MHANILNLLELTPYATPQSTRLVHVHKRNIIAVTVARISLILLMALGACAHANPTAWPYITTTPGAGYGGAWVGEMIFVDGFFYAAQGKPNTSGQVLRSPDGTTWTTLVTVANRRLLGLAHANGIFIAVGEGGVILRSMDGVAWSEIASITSTELYDVEYGNNKFIAVGLWGTVLYSADGLQWTPTQGTGTAYNVVFFNGAFYQAGSYGNLSRSTNGIDWTAITIAGQNNISVIVAGNNCLIVGSYWGDVWRSGDGVSWVKVSSGTSQGLYGGVYGDGTFVLGGTGGTIIFSTDGTNWTQAATGAQSTMNFQAIAYGNGIFLASGSYGYIYKAEEGVAMEFTATPMPLTFPGTAFGQSLTLPLRIQNTGTLLINSISISCNGLHQAAFTSNVSSGSIPAGSAKDILVTFRPLLIGTVDAQLVITARGTVLRSQTITLRGTGVRPDWVSDVPVDGRVLGLSSGLPLVGVTVMSPISTVQTDQNGHFRLQAASGLQTVVMFRMPGYLTRYATILPPTDGSLLNDVSLICSNDSGFDLGGYKRVLFDSQRSAPFHLTRWLAPPTLYIDTRPDGITGATFTEAGIRSITNTIPGFIERMTHGFLRNLEVVVGATPPSDHVIVFKLDSRISTSGAAGGGSQTDGEITYQCVSLRTPADALNSSVVFHETGHALGLCHANGNLVSLMASASIFWPNREIYPSAAETTFDLLMGQILYARFPGGETNPDETVEVEYDPIGFPLSTSSSFVPEPSLVITRSNSGMILLVKGRAQHTYLLQQSDDLKIWKEVEYKTMKLAVEQSAVVIYPKIFYRLSYYN